MIRAHPAPSPAATAAAADRSSRSGVRPRCCSAGAATDCVAKWLGARLDAGATPATPLEPCRFAAVRAPARGSSCPRRTSGRCRRTGAAVLERAWVMGAGGETRAGRLPSRRGEGVRSPEVTGDRRSIVALAAAGWGPGAGAGVGAGSGMAARVGAATRVGSGRGARDRAGSGSSVCAGIAARCGGSGASVGAATGGCVSAAGAVGAAAAGDTGCGASGGAEAGAGTGAVTSGGAGADG
jgi:hypothetical protein